MEPNRGSARDRPADAAAPGYARMTDAPVSHGRFKYLFDELLPTKSREIDEYPPQPRQSYCGYGPYHPEDPSAGDRLRSILGCLTDLYTEKDKYTGRPLDFFVTKFRLFSDRCCRGLHLAIFNDLSLRKVMRENPGKPIYDCFELLIRQLEAIFYGYHSPSLRDTALLFQLEKAVEDIPQCEIALSIKEYTYRGRIAIIRNALRLT
ncbi:hypothetical protein E4U40_002293 [Claviceps sp. LM458 group G5]|nr:hypothetical protein E4U40_002293 [Claviceps sp. LM458 group G5]